MNIKHTGLALGALVSAIAFTACQPAATNVNTNRMVNSNTAVVINNNTNAVMTNTNMNRSNSNMTREEFDRDRARYESEAKQSGRTVGTGVNDSWLWTKSRAALLTTDDLRESTINVDVSNAVVTLTGTVGTAAQKTRAEQVVKGLDGVTNVTNNLKVAPADSMTNTNTNSMVNGNTRR